MTNGVYSLNDLRDIALPEKISFWPPAVGFWILLGLVVIVLTHIALKKYKKWRVNAYRRAGLLLLKELGDNFSDDNQEATVENISLILKRVALAAYSREKVASLTGDAWLGFLNESYGGKEFLEHPAVLLKDASYRQSKESIIGKDDFKKLLFLAQTWITQHKIGEVEC